MGNPRQTYPDPHDYPNLGAYLSALAKKGRKIWRKARPDSIKKGGRRSYRDKVFEVCADLREKHGTDSNRQDQKWWIDCVADRMKRRNGKDHDRETITRYVREWIERNLGPGEVPPSYYTPDMVKTFQGLAMFGKVYLNHRQQLSDWAENLPASTTMKDLNGSMMPCDLAESLTREWNALVKSFNGVTNTQLRKAVLQATSAQTKKTEQ